MIREDAKSFDLQDIQLNADLFPQSSWGNLGYWDVDTSCFVKANENLANHLAELAGLSEASRLCDLGFGCGEQIYHWLNTYACQMITAYNPSTIQFNFASQRLQNKLSAAGYGLERVRLIQKRAEAMRVEVENFDTIIALDAAYHFDKRQEVFKRSYLSLVAGGSLAFTDMLLADGAKEKGLYPPLWFRLLLRLGGVPKANLVDMQTLRAQLEELGFKDFRFHDITDMVFPGIANYLSLFIEARRSLWKRRRLLRYQVTKYLLDLCLKKGWLRYVSYCAKK